jgi:mono/diheme cytochrome c family protein
MKNLLLLGLTAAILIGLAPGCKYDSEEDLYPNTSCDTTAVSYSSTILPILQNQCLGCHSANANSGSVNLEGYDQVKIYVDNGKLLGSIQHGSGYSPMPKDQPQLEPCTINRVASWINAGALNN